MTENLVDPTPTVETPSKFAVLKSKITREGLILGGITAGILIAGGYTLLKKQVPVAELLALDMSETTIDTVNITSSDTESPTS